jgi:hypothetical protein
VLWPIGVDLPATIRRWDVETIVEAEGDGAYAFGHLSHKFPKLRALVHDAASLL